MTPSRRDGRWVVPDADRLLTFLDAVVAIALTLLVLPLADLVPEAKRAGDSAVEVVTQNTPAIGSFLLSFWVIWRFWTLHHRLFGWAGTVGRGLMRLNLLWMLSIVLLPFASEMVSSYGVEPFVVRLYTAVLTVASTSLTAMAVVMRRAAVRGEAEVEGPPVEFVLGSVAATAGIVLAFVIVLVVPQAGYWPLIVLTVDPITGRLVLRLHRRLTAGSPAPSRPGDGTA